LDRLINTAKNISNPKIREQFLDDLQELERADYNMFQKLAIINRIRVSLPYNFQ